MTNLFLKVNKDLFKLELNPTEVLLLAQIMEFNNTTGTFFMSDKALAEMLNVSESTVSRAIKNIEGKGFITRETKNVKGGKARTITVNLANIEGALTNLKMTIDNKQNDACTTVNLTGDNKQNDLIKDNIIDNKKDNNSNSFPTIVGKEIALEELPIVTVSELVAMGARGAKYTLLDDNTVLVLGTGKRLRVKE